MTLVQRLISELLSCHAFLSTCLTKRGNQDESLGAEWWERPGCAASWDVGGCHSLVPQTMIKSMGVHEVPTDPLVGSTSITREPQISSSGWGCGAARSARGSPPHCWPVGIGALYQMGEILIYEQRNLLTPSLCGEGDVFSLACWMSRGCFELRAFLSSQCSGRESLGGDNLCKHTGYCLAS